MIKNTLLRVLPTPVVIFLKIIRSRYRAIFVFYETAVAPVIAFKMSFLLWPFFKLCEALDICFLTNIPDGDGFAHIIVESDDFFRKRFLNEVDRNKKYVLIKKKRSIPKQFLSIYMKEFYWSICSSPLFYLTLPLLIRYPSICLDCGLSHSKWNLLLYPDEAKDTLRPAWPKIITQHKHLMEWEGRAKRFVKSSHYFPLASIKIPKWIEKWENQKIALIHLKTNVGNATAKITDPSTYLPTIEYLICSGYQPIFVGREKMPEIFKKFEVFNYAQSSFANFKNDISLFIRADLAITAGSGIWLLAELTNTPFVFVNYWHLYRLPASKDCICIPTLVKNRMGGFLSFKEQWNLYRDERDLHNESFPVDKLEARNATGDEILAACQELLDLKKNEVDLSPLQKKFRDGSEYYFGNSRVCHYFLEQHEPLFETLL